MSLLKYTNLSPNIINIIQKYEFSAKNLSNIYNKTKRLELIVNVNVEQMLTRCVRNGYIGFYWNPNHIKIPYKNISHIDKTHLDITNEENEITIQVKRIEGRIVALWTLLMLNPISNII